jgi:hypothetical protein
VRNGEPLTKTWTGDVHGGSLWTQNACVGIDESVVGQMNVYHQSCQCIVMWIWGKFTPSWDTRCVCQSVIMMHQLLVVSWHQTQLINILAYTIYGRASLIHECDLGMLLPLSWNVPEPKLCFWITGEVGSSHDHSGRIAVAACSPLCSPHKLFVSHKCNSRRLLHRV